MSVHPISDRRLEEDWRRAQNNRSDESASPQRQREEEMRRALKRHHRFWDKQLERLASRPSPTPSFGGSARPPSNIENEYNRMRERWLAQREAIEKNFDQRRDNAPIVCQEKAKDKVQPVRTMRRDFRRRSRHDGPERRL